MVNKTPLHQEANEIRNDRTTSFETKELLIDTLKKESGYQKDLELSDKKRSKHREQQDILTKLGEQGIDDQLVDSVRKSLYPGYDPSHKKYDTGLESVEDSLEGVTEEMKSNMDYRNGEMKDWNKVGKEDMEKLYKLPLSVREEGGERIVNREGFGEFGSTMNSGMENADMDKDGKREIDNLSESKAFLDFKHKVKGMEMMSVKQHIELMNMVGKQLGIEDKIDLNYINIVFKTYLNENLSGHSDLSRILRGLSVILGKGFVIPISVNGKKVRSFDCINYDSGVYEDYDDYLGTRPFFKVVRSTGS